MITRLSRLCCHAVFGLWLLQIPGVIHAQTPSLYEKDFPGMAYGTAELEDAIAHLQERLDGGEVLLQFHQQRGFLDSLLQALQTDSSSQLLVFSKTSLQTGLISPATPRAIYFNDEVYIAWMQGAQALEIAAMDPNLGPVFYTLSQQAAGQPVFERHLHQCLRCL